MANGNTLHMLLILSSSHIWRSIFVFLLLLFVYISCVVVFVSMRPINYFEPFTIYKLNKTPPSSWICEDISLILLVLSCDCCVYFCVFSVSLVACFLMLFGFGNRCPTQIVTPEGEGVATRTIPMCILLYIYIMYKCSINYLTLARCPVHRSSLGAYAALVFLCTRVCMYLLYCHRVPFD